MIMAKIFILKFLFFSLAHHFLLKEFREFQTLSPIILLKKQKLLLFTYFRQ